MTPFLSWPAICSSMHAHTRSGISGSSVTSTNAEEGPCSPWATRSEATNAGTAEESASTAASLGPAGKSMRTSFCRRIFASVTNLLPGPTIFCTGSMLSVPRAMAAMAWAPPTW